MSYHARIVALALVSFANSATSVEVRLELSGEQTPPLYAFDAVSVALTRVEAAPQAPALLASEPIQRFNAVVQEVHNNAPSAPLVVNVAVLGAAPQLAVYEGDLVEVDLTVVAASPVAPAPIAQTPPPPPPPATQMPVPLEPASGEPAPLAPASGEPAPLEPASVEPADRAKQVYEMSPEEQERFWERFDRAC